MGYVKPRNKTREEHQKEIDRKKKSGYYEKNPDAEGYDQRDQMFYSHTEDEDKYSDDY